MRAAVKRLLAGDRSVPALACLPALLSQKADRQTDRQNFGTAAQRETVCVWNTAEPSDSMCSPLLSSPKSSPHCSRPHNDAIHHEGRENKFHIGETALLQEDV